jgi:adenylate cyclase class 2
VELFFAATKYDPIRDPQVSTETEIKVKIEDVGDFCRQLNDLNPETLFARHLEDNLLLDFSDSRLGLNHCLLRIRLTEDRHLLTYKGPPKADGIFKIREELETELRSGETLLQVLERIGMSVSFRYQKYRQEFVIGDVHVAVDETPIGNYVEFEGSQTGILNLAAKMRIDKTMFLRSSYYSLYLEYCREKGKTPEFMVFGRKPRISNQ